MSLTKVSYSMISGAVVNALDYGASTSASASVNAAAIQAAIVAVSTNGGTVYLPSGVYNLGNNTITINVNGVSLVGDASPYDYSIGKGTIISYTGTGVGSIAIKVFTDVAVYPSYFGYAYASSVQNIAIRCAAGTETGLLANTVNSTFTNVQISGQSGDGNTGSAGVLSNNSINTTFNNVLIQGDVGTNYLNRGFWFTSNVTTCVLNSCYIRQCQSGLQIDTSCFVTLNNTILESHQVQAVNQTGGELWLNDCWLEASPVCVATADKVQLIASGGFWQQLNVGTGNYFNVIRFTSDSSITLRDVTFSTGGGTGTKDIFKSTNSIALGNIILDNVQYRTSGGCVYQIGGASNSLPYTNVSFGSNNIVAYRFTQTNVQASQTYNTTPSDSVTASGSSYIADFNGVVVGYNIYYTSNVTANGISVSPLINSSGVSNLGQSVVGYQPAIGASKGSVSGKIFVDGSFGNTFSKGASLGVQLVTTAGFLPVAGTVTVDLLVLPSIITKE